MTRKLWKALQELKTCDELTLVAPPELRDAVLAVIDATKDFESTVTSEPEFIDCESDVFTEDVCDECGATVPRDSSNVNEHHSKTCSLHPDNVINGDTQEISIDELRHEQREIEEADAQIDVEPID
jgi:hypothetical protein